MKKLNLKQKIELKKLKDHNISVLEIHYDGGGDDGMIHDIHAFDKDYNEIIIPKFCEKYSAFGIKTLEDTFYELLCDNIEWDWVNNEGGFGSFKIDLQDESITIFHNQRHVEYYEYKVKNESKKMFKIINGTS